MISREQENEIDRLAALHGSAAIRDGFEDHHIDVTFRGGKCFHVSEDGASTETHPNHSVRWLEERV